MDETLYEGFNGADILIHEVMSEAAIAELPQSWQTYRYQAHTSTRQLAEIANAVKSALLVAVFVGWFMARQALENELSLGRRSFAL